MNSTAGAASAVRRESAALVIVDIQERLAPAMSRGDEVIRTTRFLVDAAAVLGIPAVVTRQYPKGLGDTVAELRDIPAADDPIDRLTFNCFADPAFRERFERLRRRQVVLVGMETHICVTQTALALLAEGYEPFVVADATCSQSARDYEVALDRLRLAGVAVTTAESVVYEALGCAGTPEFKAVLELVKQRCQAG